MLYVLIIAMLSSANSFAAISLTGSARAISGTTIELGGKRISLYGVDSPDVRQYCKLDDGKPYPCGRLAAESLIRIIGAKTVTCQLSKEEPITDGRCFVDGKDIAITMIESGYAMVSNKNLDYNPVLNDYRHHMSEAKSKGIGLWQGTFIDPSIWRLNTKIAKPAGG